MKEVIDKFRELDDKIRANHPNDPELAEKIIRLGKQMVKSMRRSCFVK